MEPASDDAEESGGGEEELDGELDDLEEEEGEAGMIRRAARFAEIDLEEARRAFDLALGIGRPIPSRLLAASCGEVPILWSPCRRILGPWGRWVLRRLLAEAVRRGIVAEGPDPVAWTSWIGALCGSADAARDLPRGAAVLPLSGLTEGLHQLPNAETGLYDRLLGCATSKFDDAYESADCIQVDRWIAKRGRESR